MASAITLNGLQISLAFLIRVPCIRRTGREIIFLLDPLIELKNTKCALWGEKVKTFSAPPVISARLPKAKACPCILVMVTVALEVCYTC